MSLTNKNRKFAHLMGEINRQVSDNSELGGILAAADLAMEYFPNRAEDVMKAVAPSIYNKAEAADFWDIVIKHREDLVETFMDLNFKTIPPFFFGMISRISHRQNVSVIKQVIDYLLKKKDVLAQDIHKRLLYPALRDAMYERGTELFDFIVKHPDISRWRFQMPEGDGNALLLWVLSQPEDAASRNTNTIAYTLRKLLEAEVKVKANFNNVKSEFPSLMKMLCWEIDDFQGGYLHVIEHLIRQGVDWEDLDQGETSSAWHIQQQPTVKAYHRMQALSGLIDTPRNEEISKITMKPKM